MQKYFFISTILFVVVCFLQDPAEAKISCYVNQNANAPPANVTGCNFCGYIGVESSNNANSPNGVTRYCLQEDSMTYHDGDKDVKFTTLNCCMKPTDNNQKSHLLICDTDECNWDCDGCKDGAASLSLSILGLILSVFIPLKLC